MAGMDPTQAAAEAQKTIADLGLTDSFERARIGEGEGNLKAGVTQSETAREQQEPRSYRTQQNVAIAHGIASTGMASAAHSNLVNRFAAQRTANQARLLQGEAGFAREREGVGLKKTLGEHGAYATQAAQEGQYAADHPPTPPVQTPQGGYPGQSQGAAEHPGTWVGGVRVGYVPPKVQWSRDPKVRERQSKEIADGRLSA